MNMEGGGMRKVILVPDSFKDDVICRSMQIMSKAVRLHFPKAEILSMPVSDGGKAADAFLSAVGGRRSVLL